MDTYLFSIHPKWCKKIFNGEKTIEVRKTAPKPPFKVVVYCTKSMTHLYRYDKYIDENEQLFTVDYNKHSLMISNEFNGKVIGEFICDKVYRTDWDSCGVFLRDLQSGAVINGQDGFTEYRDNDITRAQHIDYAGMKCAYALHITAPVLYDEPKELGDYKTVRFVRGYHKKNETMIERLQNSKRVEVTYVSKAPQNYMRIQDTEEDQMNREILFRGFHECENGTEIAVVNGKEYKGKWEFGYYWTNEAGNYFIKVIRDLNGNFVGNPTTNDYEVFPETVGQWTGLTDKNGKKIFEHDRVKYKCGDIAKVIFTEYGAFVGETESLSHENIGGVLTEVIGTIFDKEEV